MGSTEGSDEQQDLSDVDEVWLGDRSVSGEEFVEALNKVGEMQDVMRNIRDDLKMMDIGLDRDDAVALLWGRTTMNKTQIQSAFETMDAIIEEDPQDIAPRLLADKTSDLTIGDAAKVWDDLMELADKYGDNEADQ
jgi:hypothetical protein